MDATAAELAAIGDTRTFTADLGAVNGVYALATHLTDRESALRLLINIAGANWGAPIDDFPASGWDKVLNVNLKGVFVLTQALLPLLRAASVPGDPARVVNIGSIDGLRAPERGYNNFSYAASKAGVHLLTQQLSAELAPGITVNAIAPGLFESKMTGALLEFARDQVSERIP
ncbi:SDR family NAD(P)-dependent oxidoreductase, partial [Gordonia sp. VNK21]|uniref:SDR family NAD(P)-dependent oxidoreductase n=1 Tax=Gordonia sp. VNK21 TaxID=3382483 RepID=UPI0038D43173